MNLNNYFSLYASCIPVNGAVNYVICDLDRGKIQYIPYELFKILTDYKNLKLHEVLNNFEEADSSIILEYFSFLVENELGFYTNSPHSFPELDKVFHEPEIINNSIIEINTESNIEDINLFLNQISDFGCKYLEIRIFSDLDIFILFNSLIDFSKSSIQNITIHSVCSKSNFQTFLNLHESEPRISQCYLYIEEMLSDDLCSELRNSGIEVLNTQLSNLNCGVISQPSFSCKTSTYLESVSNNTCLNRKVSMDTSGNIKNCPSMANNFGNIRINSIQEILDNSEFHKLWKLKKDEIEVCKSCEFRYVCTDCRAFLINPEEITSKPLKCGYDPYTGISLNWADIVHNKLTFIKYQMFVNGQ